MNYTLINVTERDLRGRESVLPIKFTDHVFSDQWRIGRYITRKLREQGFYPMMQYSEIRPFFRRGAIYRQVDAPNAWYRVRFLQVSFIDDEDAPDGGHPNEVYVTIERLV